jgi:hypothetical protein
MYYINNINSINECSTSHRDQTNWKLLFRTFGMARSVNGSMVAWWHEVLTQHQVDPEMATLIFSSRLSQLTEDRM